MANISIGKKDVIWSYLGSFFRLAANIILLPFMLHFLSDEDLGMWYVFAGIAQFVVLLDFGFAPALSRNIAYIWCGAKVLQKEDITTEKQVETDFATFKKVLKTCQYIYLALATIAFILLATIGTYYILSLDTSNKDVLLSWVIYGTGVVLNLYYSYFTSFLRGVGAIAENNVAGVISKAIQILLSCILLYLGWGLLGASIGYLISGIALRAYSIRAFYRYNNIGVLLKNSQYVIKLRECYDMFVVIWHNASKEGLIMIANYLTTQANTLICSSVLGLSTTGSYGISVQLATVVTGMANIPYGTYQPKMMEKILNGDKIGSLKLFSGTLLLFSAVYIIMAIAAMLAIPLIVLLKPTFSINYSMMAVLFIFMYIDKIYHNFSSYISNSNRLPYTIPFVISSTCSVLFSYILAKSTNMGIWALIIAPIFVALAYNSWRWPVYVLKDNNIDFKRFIEYGIASVKDITQRIKCRIKKRD